MSALTTLAALLVLPVGIYELVTGRMPGGPQRWGVYRWLSTPSRIRVASLLGLGACVVLLLRYPPVTIIDLIAGVVGLAVGGTIVMGSRQSNPHP